MNILKKWLDSPKLSGHQRSRCAFSDRRAELDKLLAEMRQSDSDETAIKIRDTRFTGDLYGERTPYHFDETPVDLQFRQEMPSCSLDELSPELIRAALNKAGCLYVPGALDQVEAEELRQLVIKAHEAKDSDNPDPAWYSPPKLGNHASMFEMASVREWSQANGGSLAADSPRAMLGVCEMYERHGLLDLAEKYLGEPPVYSMSKFMLWQVEPNEERQPGAWHQDGSFLGDRIDIAALNIWTALSDCGKGVGAPGMELVLDYPHQYFKAEEDAEFHWSITDDQVDKMFRGEYTIVIPEYKAGDMMIFDNWILHRTSQGPGMTKPRWAIETWFFAPSVFPLGREALLV